MGKLWTIILRISFALVVIGAFLLGAGRQIYQADGPLRDGRVVEVPKGAGLLQIADKFERDGVIANAMIFVIAARIGGVVGDLKAGEYMISRSASMASVMDAVTKGKALEHRVTVAEGLTSREVVDLINQSEVLTGEITEAPSEGSLAPDTYFVRRGETREAVLRRMQGAQERILQELWAIRAKDLPLNSPEEALILASIVEKETGVSSERAEVAGVFVNRLRLGMRLQTDPTVIYGITEGLRDLGRELTRKDLREPSAYNTYTIDGLPPGPIANPGKSAIEAALNPAETEYLYFVADGTGGHVFGKTLREHNANVANWRKIKREREAAAENGE